MKNEDGKHLATLWNKMKKRMSKDKETLKDNLEPETAETTATAEEKTGTENTEATELNEVEKLQEELAETNKKFLYLMSEFENYKRRTAKERMELFKNASKDLIVDLLPVMDDFERGLQAMDVAKDVAAVKTGVDLVYNKFRAVLSQKGLQPMESVGSEFDTELHEAISQAPAENDKQKNKVIAEVEKGYRLNEQVIRYAKVIVGV